MKSWNNSATPTSSCSAFIYLLEKLGHGSMCHWFTNTEKSPNLLVCHSPIEKKDSFVWHNSLAVDLKVSTIVFLIELNTISAGVYHQDTVSYITDCFGELCPRKFRMIHGTSMVQIAWCVEALLMRLCIDSLQPNEVTIPTVTFSQTLPFTSSKLKFK